MQYFKFIANIDVAAALAEVEANGQWFTPHVPRPEIAPPLREGRSIFLRGPDHESRPAELSEYSNARQISDKILDAVDTINMSRLPECAKLIKLAASMIDTGNVGRCYVAKLVPGGTIYPHIDPGKYFTVHDRYHIVLKTNPGVSFSCGSMDNNETVRFEQGQLWVFNNKVTHWAKNNGDTDRIHIIMDYRSDDLQFKQFKDY